MLTRLIGATLLVLLLAGGAWYLFAPDTMPGAGAGAATERGGGGGGQGRGGPPRETLVIVRPVVETRVDDRLEALGDAEAAASVTVGPREAGVVTEVAVVSGAAVSAGDTIVTLDDEVEVIARDIAAREVEDATVARDRAARLVRSRAGAQTDLDAAQNTLARAELALRDAALRLARRTVTAPIGGTLGLVEVERGDRVVPDTALVTIDDRRVLHVEFRVPERFAGRIETGRRVRIDSFALPGRSFDGTIIAVGGRVERGSRTLPVRASVDNAGDRLRPGMSFAVTLEFEGETLPAIDPLAVQWDSSGSFTWKITSADGASSATRVPVRIVQRNPEAVLVSGELLAGDRVVTEGVLSLREGAAVRVAGGDGDDGGGEPAATPAARATDGGT